MPASAVDKYIFSFFVSVCSIDKDLVSFTVFLIVSWFGLFVVSSPVL